MKMNRMRLKRWDPIELISQYNKSNQTLIHVGAHYGEELEQYERIGFSRVLWIEAQPSAFKILKSNVGEENCLEGAIWDETGLEMEFNQTNNSVSSGFFELTKDNIWKNEVKIEKKIKIKTITLSEVVKEFERRTLLDERFVLRLDVQGSEYRILKSSVSLLKRMDYICCEVTRGSDAYEGAETRKKIVLLLLRHNWIPIFNRINPVNSHGETIFVPVKDLKKYLKPLIYMRIVSISDYARYHFRKNLRHLSQNHDPST